MLTTGVVSQRVIKRYAVTSAPLEKSIGVACSFKSACHIERPSELYTAIAEAIDSLVLQGPQLIKQKFQRRLKCNNIPHPLDI